MWEGRTEAGDLRAPDMSPLHASSSLAHPAASSDPKLLSMCVVQCGVVTQPVGWVLLLTAYEAKLQTEFSGKERNL